MKYFKNDSELSLDEFFKSVKHDFTEIGSIYNGPGTSAIAYEAFVELISTRKFVLNGNTYQTKVK